MHVLARAPHTSPSAGIQPMPQAEGPASVLNPLRLNACRQGMHPHARDGGFHDETAAPPSPSISRHGCRSSLPRRRHRAWRLIHRPSTFDQWFIPAFQSTRCFPPQVLPRLTSDILSPMQFPGGSEAACTRFSGTQRHPRPRSTQVAYSVYTVPGAALGATLRHGASGGGSLRSCTLLPSTPSTRIRAVAYHSIRAVHAAKTPCSHARRTPLNCAGEAPRPWG